MSFLFWFVIFCFLVFSYDIDRTQARTPYSIHQKLINYWKTDMNDMLIATEKRHFYC